MVDSKGAQRYGHFEVQSRPDGSLWELGRGGMGVTYKAFDRKLLVDVVLKLPHKFLLDERGLRLFLREARAAAKVRHPNIASIIYLGDEEPYFYVMEFVAGQSLERLLRKRHTLPAREALDLIDQIAAALQALYEVQIVHRDLTPTNLLLVPDEDRPFGYTVKLIDFGLAKGVMVAGVAAETHLQGGSSQSGVFCGTIEFASPEQCNGSRELDSRSDLYSVGVILWHMLTGGFPFEGSLARIICQHQFDQPPWSALMGEPAPVVALLRRLLAKDPADRFASPRQLREAIREIAAGLAAPARPVAAPRAVSTLSGSARPASPRSLAGTSSARGRSAWLGFAALTGVVAAWALTREAKPPALVAAGVVPPPISAPAPQPAPSPPPPRVVLSQPRLSDAKFEGEIQIPASPWPAQASATRAKMLGGVRFHAGNALSRLEIAEIANESPAAPTGPLVVSVWACETDYVDGQMPLGVSITHFELSPLAPAASWRKIVRTAPRSFQPAGMFHLVLTLTEASPDRTTVLDTRYLGARKLEAGDPVFLQEPVQWKVDLQRREVDFTVGSLRNGRKTSTAPLRLEVWLWPQGEMAFDPAAGSCQIASVGIPPLTPGESRQNSRHQVRLLAVPPAGDYSFRIVLLEGGVDGQEPLAVVQGDRPYRVE